ncbi:hypothetical protein INR49_007882 [Caranx melampygus]|nr:hypothetical protein INR49_007882 [Caranx melampygus]
MQVLNICSKEDYSGLDYLPAVFPHWLQEPGRLIFIAKIKGRVVAMESTLFVDGGQTVVFQGFRLVPDLRGSGIAGALQKHVDAYIRHHHPEVSTARLTRGDQPSPQVLAKYRFVAKEAILSLCCEASDLGPFVSELRSRLPSQTGPSSHGPVSLTQQQAETLILTDHVISNLLPGKTIINDWEPLKPMKANMEVLRRRRLIWMADRESEPSVVSVCTAPYSVPYRHDALRININILVVLEALLPSVQGYLVCHTYVDPAVWSGLREFCQNKANVSFYKDYWEEVLLEKDL